MFGKQRQMFKTLGGGSVLLVNKLSTTSLASQCVLWGTQWILRKVFARYCRPNLQCKLFYQKTAKSEVGTRQRAPLVRKLRQFRARLAMFEIKIHRIEIKASSGLSGLSSQCSGTNYHRVVRCLSNLAVLRTRFQATDRCRNSCRAVRRLSRTMVQTRAQLPTRIDQTWTGQVEQIKFKNYAYSSLEPLTSFTLAMAASNDSLLAQ